MLLSAITQCLLAFATVSVCGMPFQPVPRGPRQLNHRRAIDYPHGYHRAKRSVGYSVVQVDGGPSSSPAPAAPPAPSTVMQTITRSSPPVQSNTQLPVPSPAAPSPISAETVRLTTTQQTEKTVTETQIPSAPVLPNAPTSSSPSASPAPAIPWTSTVLHVVTSTAVTSQPQAFYDDGLWHTYYPIKSFVPPAYSTASSVESSTSISGSVWTPSPSSTWSASSSWTPTPTWSSTSSQAGAWQAGQTSANNLTNKGSLEARKTPVDLKLASWTTTATNDEHD